MQRKFQNFGLKIYQITYFSYKKIKIKCKHFLTKFGNPLKVQKIEQ